MCKTLTSAPTASLTLSPIGGPAGTDPIAVGRKYAASLDTASPFDIENFNEWGTESDFGLQTEAVGITFHLEASDTAGERRLVVDDFMIVIPSFKHSATDPEETGANIYLPRSGFASTGFLDIDTGSFTATLYSVLSNDYYGGATAVPTTINVSGTMDFESMTVVASFDGFSYTE